VFAGLFELGADAEAGLLVDGVAESSGVVDEDGGGDVGDGDADATCDVDADGVGDDGVVGGEDAADGEAEAGVGVWHKGSGDGDGEGAGAAHLFEGGGLEVGPPLPPRDMGLDVGAGLGHESAKARGLTVGGVVGSLAG